MAEDWAAVAAEVADALKSVAYVDAGYPATLRRVTTTANPYDPAGGTTTIAYSTVYVVQTENKERDRDGMLTGTVRRSLLVAAGDTVPLKSDKVFIGQSLTYADEATDATIDWEEIDDVMTISPAGTDVMYEIMLAG